MYYTLVVDDKKPGYYPSTYRMKRGDSIDAIIAGRTVTKKIESERYVYISLDQEK